MREVAKRPGVDLLVVERNSRDDHYWERAGESELFELVSLSTEPLGEVGRHMLARYELTLQRFQPEVICINGYTDPVASLTFEFAKRNPDCFVLLWSETTAFDQRRQWWRERRKSYLLRSCDGALVAGSPHCKYLQNLGMPAERIRIVGGCVDNDYFRDGTDHARKHPGERRNLGLPDNFFLYVGRFISVKNLHVLLRAFQKYWNRNGRWSLVLVGTGEDEVHLQQAAAAQGTSAVYFAGLKQLPELVKYYAFASCFVLPSISEPWGLVVNEAMASRLPVLVSNRCGCAADLVEEGANGFLFDPEDVDALADMMATISSNRLDLVKMGESSRERVAAFNPCEFARAAVEHISFLRGTLGKCERQLWKLSRTSSVGVSVNRHTEG
jgi:glycosyltransferase involved in cell wall biosynthesis